MRVLLSAYSCLPGRGSEPGIGWNWANNIARIGHDVTVITRLANRTVIDGFLANHSIEGLKFFYWDLPKIWWKMYKLPLGNYLYYFLWQFTAAREARRINATERFDLVQHITWGSLRIPSFMGSLGIPFVFGPVAGGEDTPKQLRGGLGVRGRVSDALRRISNSCLGTWMRPTYKRASLIVTTTRETLEMIPARFRHKSAVCQAIGVNPDEFETTILDSSDAVKPSSRLELLFVGRLLAWKGVHLILRALAMVRASSSEIHFTIIGSGKDRMRLDRLATELGVTDRISWIPWMPREELLKTYNKFDLFVFPSMHDSGGTAVLEAMSFGLPVLCLDLGGPAMSVTNECGCVIRTGEATGDQVVASIAGYITEVLANPSLLKASSVAARKRVQCLTWITIVERVYNRL
jgi:glycosyltransferase involved in cell wall biosynthesis